MSTLSGDALRDAINAHVRKQQFEYSATWPLSWRLQSWTLKHAADHLYDIYYAATKRDRERGWQSIEKAREAPEKKMGSGRMLEGEELEDSYDRQLKSVYFLLMGYSMENLLKGILILRHPEYFKPSETMNNIKSHKLARLCDRCKITITKEERDILDRLTLYIEWLGKYPVPLDSEEMLPKKKEDGTWTDKGESFRGREPQEETDAIWVKLWNVLEENAAALRQAQGL